MNKKGFIEALEKNEMTYFKSGNNIMINCCFHGEDSPSLGVNFKKGVYNCFGCAAAGGISELIKVLFKQEGYEELELDIADEPEKNVDLSGMQERLKNIRSNGITKNEIKIKVMKGTILEKYEKPFGKYSDYLKNRGLNKSSLELFDLRCGYWKGSERVIFPIRDEYCRLISMSGRSVTTDDKVLKARKSRDSEYSKVLYGLREILIKYGEECRVGVMVEGEIDMIYLNQFGLPTFSVGCKMPSECQQFKISKYFDYVFISLDGDVKKKEISAVVRRMREIVDCGTIELPSDKDPNNLSKKEISVIYRDVYKYIKEQEEEIDV